MRSIFIFFPVQCKLKLENLEYKEIYIGKLLINDDSYCLYNNFNVIKSLKYPLSCTVFPLPISCALTKFSLNDFHV